jgi:hypothetical protein
MWCAEKSLKTTKNQTLGVTLKATKNSSKINNFLCTPKVPKYPTNLAIFPKVNNRKGSKKLTKCLVFKHPKMAFYFWTKPFGACKKTTPNNKEGYLAPYKTRQNPKNLCFPKSKQPKKT